MKLPEFIYLSLTGLTLALFRINALTIRSELELPATDTIFSVYLFAMPTIFLYLYALKSQSLSRSALLTFVITILTTALVDSAFDASNLFEMHTNYTSYSSFMFYVVAMIVFCFSSGLLALFLERISRKWRTLLIQNEKLQYTLILLSSCFVVLLAIFRLRISGLSFADATDSFFVINFLAILPFIVAVFVFSKISRQHDFLQRELDKRENIQIHLKALEQQYSAMRKFKHDYQNIFISMENFLLEDRLPELKQYYFEKIRPASEVMTQDNFVLEALSKIKIPEIKSLISAKIILTQNIARNIETSFEAIDNIDDIYMDSITLVRMLGIILDNAIEELNTLGKGKLAIACFANGESVTFIVQNTCRPDIPNIQTLKQSGFSTKVNHNGLGLNILSELQASTPNVTLSTMIEEELFTQKLVSKNQITQDLKN